jgi:hypothetical protein
MIFDVKLGMCMMMRRSILGLLYVPSVSSVLRIVFLTAWPNSNGNDKPTNIGRFRCSCVGSNFLEFIKQTTLSRDGVDAKSSSRWVYFRIGERDLVSVSCLKTFLLIKTADLIHAAFIS